MKMRKFFFLFIAFFLPLSSYTQSGTTDQSFGIAGKFSLPFTTSDGFRIDEIDEIVIQSNDLDNVNFGKILMVGTCTDVATNKSVIAVVRLNPNGMLDTTFDSDGVSVNNYFGNNALQGNVTLSDIVVDAGGKINTTGYLEYFDENSHWHTAYLLSRFTADGTSDTSFDNDGVLLIDDFDNLITLKANYGYSLAVQTDGKVLIAGAERDTSTGNFYYKVVRVNTNGTLDNSFDGDGRFYIDFETNYTFDIPWKVKVQPDGKIVLVGVSLSTVTEDDFTIVRLNSNGSLDSQFGTNGVSRVDFGQNEWAFDFDFNSGGGIVVAGRKSLSFGSSENSYAVAWLTANGTLDTNFGDNNSGKKVIDLGGNATCNAIALQSDGKILLSGSLVVNDSSYQAVVRLNANGDFDQTFNQDGKLLVNDTGFLFEARKDIAVQRDGRILVLGMSFVTRLFGDPSCLTVLHVTPEAAQYSDLINLTASTACNPNQENLNVEFRIGNILLGSAPIVNGNATLSNAVLLEDMLYSELNMYPPQQTNGPLKPGNKIVTASVVGDNPNYLITYATTQLRISCEDATLSYSGEPFLFVNPYFSLVYTQFICNVTDENDGLASRGDIRNGSGTFWNHNLNGDVLGDGTIPVSLSNNSNTTEGYFATVVPVDINPVQQNNGGIILKVFSGLGNYYCGDSGGDYTPVTLGIPGTENCVGGGFVNLTASSGQFSGDANSLMKFGFLFKGKNQTNSPQITVVYKKNISGLQHVFEIETLDLNNAIVDKTNQNADYRKAYVKAKATLKDITNPSYPILIGEKLKLEFTVWESVNDFSGASDKIAVELRDKDNSGPKNPNNTVNKLLFSSNWSGNSILPQNLNKGKISIGTGEAHGNQHLSNQNATNAFMIFPNPSRNQFQLVFQSFDNLSVEVFVYDVLGKKVFQIDGKDSDAIVFGDNLPAGLYLLQIRKGESIYQTKIIKESH